MILAEKIERNVYVKQEDFVSQTTSVMALIPFVFSSLIINEYYIYIYIYIVDILTRKILKSKVSEMPFVRKNRSTRFYTVGIL